MEEKKVILKRIQFYPYQTKSGRIPVWEFIMKLPQEDRKKIGHAIKAIEFGWPIGRPVCAKLRGNIWECRVLISDNRQARVLFSPFENKMIALHAIIKKQGPVPKKEIEIAEKRLKILIDSANEGSRK